MKNVLKVKASNTASSSERNERIFEFLSNHPVGVLATVDPNNNPHGAVIYFSANEDFEITFITRRETKKHDNLKHNTHAMLVSFDAATQTSVQIKGVAEDITHTPEANTAFNRMIDAAAKTSNDGVLPISKLVAGSYVTYRLKPVQIVMAVYDRPDRGGYEMLEVIDF